jgi:hypothetical protein
MLLPHHDAVYLERQLTTGCDYKREFYYWDFQSLDAPTCVPAGSTRSNDLNGTPFSVTSWIFRS